jgi:hypothetical protein
MHLLIGFIVEWFIIILSYWSYRFHVNKNEEDMAILSFIILCATLISMFLTLAAWIVK